MPSEDQIMQTMSQNFNVNAQPSTLVQQPSVTSPSGVQLPNTAGVSQLMTPPAQSLIPEQPQPVLASIAAPLPVAAPTQTAIVQTTQQ